MTARPSRLWPPPAASGLRARVHRQPLGRPRRVDHLVTLDTPPLGSHAPAWLPTPLLSQLDPGGPFLEHLNAQPPPEGVSVLSIGAARKEQVQWMIARQFELKPEDLGEDAADALALCLTHGQRIACHAWHP